MKPFEPIKKRAADTRRKETHGVIAYTREVGPICYEVSLRRNTPDIASLLLDSTLDWWWESEGQDHGKESSGEPVLPFIRAICPLTSVSIDDFASDFDCIDEEGEGLDITIFGFTGITDLSLDGEILSREVTTFLKSEQCRLQMVIHLFSDSYHDRLFVSQKPSEAVSTLLEALGVTPEYIVKTFPYKRLNYATLENRGRPTNSADTGLLRCRPSC